MQIVQFTTITKDPSQVATELKRIINAGNTIIAYNVDSNSSRTYNYLTIVAERSDNNVGFTTTLPRGRR